MKKQIKALLASVLTIALCLSLIAGSTFALFTSSTDIDVEVDSGRVWIQAGLTTPVLYSVTPDANGDEFDENGKPYSYVKQEGDNFANGGTAKLNADGTISLVNVTPGDKITFSLTGLNNSDVAVQYRYKIECIDGYQLMSQFVTTIEGTKYAALAAYTSDWAELAVGANIDKTAGDEEGVQLALELPVSVSECYSDPNKEYKYQDSSATIKLTVEAVQRNADVENPGENKNAKYITTAADSAELAAKLASDDYLHVFVDNDIDDTIYVNFDMDSKVIDANYNNVALNFGSGDKENPITVENVLITNIDDTADETPAVTITSSVVGDITVTNSVLYNGAKAPYGCIAANGSSPELDLTVEGCTMISGVGAVDADGNPVYAEKYGIYATNAQNLTVRDTTFVGFGSWAIIVNGTTTGNIVISGCTFEDCAGIFKTSVTGVEDWQTGSLNGNFTFANNAMYNCTMKDNTYMQMKTLYGSITFANNTHNDVVVTVEDMKCEYLTEKYNAQ